jgi:predicted HD phosphohydrolase
MREDEVVIFEANPYHQDAVKIRKWDDHGKALGGETKSFIDYAPMLQKIVDRHFS